MSTKFERDEKIHARPDSQKIKQSLDQQPQRHFYPFQVHGTGNETSFAVHRMDGKWVLSFSVAAPRDRLQISCTTHTARLKIDRCVWCCWKITEASSLSNLNWTFLLLRSDWFITNTEELPLFSNSWLIKYTRPNKYKKPHRSKNSILASFFWLPIL